MAFDLGELLKDVSSLDTNREQIEYIPLNLLWNDPNNFYLLSGVEELAANISLCGLQQPIRVRKHPTEEGQYMIVSGHRRRAALALLAEEEPERWKDIPCIVEQDEIPQALQQLRLIYANANTREMTSAELAEQAAQVEKLLYQLKEEGYEFPGRMRDHVAKAVNASKTKLARLKVIRENLAGFWKPDYRTGALTESVAYELARLPKEWQEVIYNAKHNSVRSLYCDMVKSFSAKFERLAGMECKHGCSYGCENISVMMEKNAKEQYVTPCAGCCFDCVSLQNCKSSCSRAASYKKEKLDAIKASERATAEARAKRDQPIIDYLRGVYDRVGKARFANGVTVEDLYRAQGRIYSIADEKKQREMESGKVQFTNTTPLPFGYSFYPSAAQALCNVADALHCTTDYLLGREKDVSNSDTWKNGCPDKPGTYIVFAQYCDGGKRTPGEAEWDGERWTRFGQDIAALGMKVFVWIERPKIPEAKSSALNDSCITGMSPTGHCGAAAYCSEKHTCCLQCADPCSIRCGWLGEEA